MLERIQYIIPRGGVGHSLHDGGRVILVPDDGIRRYRAHLSRARASSLIESHAMCIIFWHAAGSEADIHACEKP